MTHELKIQKQWADAKLAGEKPFEIRINDRGFQKGDIVRYKVIDPKTGEAYVPASPDPAIPDGFLVHPLEMCDFIITYVIEGKDGLERGYCVFADQPVPRNAVARERVDTAAPAAKPDDRPEGLCRCSDPCVLTVCPYRRANKSTGESECFNRGACAHRIHLPEDRSPGRNG